MSTGKQNIKSFLDNESISLVNKREKTWRFRRFTKRIWLLFSFNAGVGVQYIMDNVSKALLTNIEGTHKIINGKK